MVSFQSEMDLPRDDVYGTPAQFVAAWRHIHELFAAHGVHNVLWVWDVTGFTRHGWKFPKLYPGDSYVNWIMWDPYNWYGCMAETPHVWKPFSEIVSPMYDWLIANSGKAGNGHYLSKPWGIGEFGTAEGPTPESKAEWFENLASTVETSFPHLKALVYFDPNDVANGRHCKWAVNSSPRSLAGFQRAGRMPSVAPMPVAGESDALRGSRTSQKP
jgi:beta-mannanase